MRFDSSQDCKSRYARNAVLRASPCIRLCLSVIPRSLMYYSLFLYLILVYKRPWGLLVIDPSFCLAVHYEMDSSTTFARLNHALRRFLCTLGSNSCCQRRGPQLHLSSGHIDQDMYQFSYCLRETPLSSHRSPLYSRSIIPQQSKTNNIQTSIYLIMQDLIVRRVSSHKAIQCL